MYCLPDQNICTHEKALKPEIAIAVRETMAHAQLIPLGVFNGRAYSYNKVGDASYILIQDEKSAAFDVLGE